MTPTARGEVDDLLESEESWPERTMLRVSTAKECLATESAQSKIDQPWCVTRQPTPHGYRWNRRALFATTRTRDQHQYLDTAPLLQECRSALASALLIGQYACDVVVGVDGGARLLIR